MAEQGNVFGFYVLLKSLGRGGMGEVSLAKPLAENCGIPTPVVVKRLHSELATHDHFVLRFEHEAKIAAPIAHPNVARVFDAGRVDDTLYLTMQYIEGWSISKVIERLGIEGRSVSLRSIADVTIGILKGTGALHSAKDEQGKELAIVHRDICPKNVMLSGNRLPMLIDFGLGKSRIQDWKTRTGTVMGTPGYMAPEQVLAEEVDHRTDLYACGIILYELLALKPYIDRGPLSDMLRASALPIPKPVSLTRPDTPPALDAVVLKALAREPEDRFNSADEFIDALDKAIPKEELPSIFDVIGSAFDGDLAAMRAEHQRLIDTTKPTFGASIGKSKVATETYAVSPDVAIGDLRTSFEEAVKAEQTYSVSASDASYETILPDGPDADPTTPDSPHPLSPMPMPMPIAMAMPMAPGAMPMGRSQTPLPFPGMQPGFPGQPGFQGQPFIPNGPQPVGQPVFNPAGVAPLAVPQPQKSKGPVYAFLGVAALAATFLLGRVTASSNPDVVPVQPMNVPPEPAPVGARGGTEPTVTANGQPTTPENPVVPAATPPTGMTPPTTTTPSGTPPTNGNPSGTSPPTTTTPTGNPTANPAGNPSSNPAVNPTPATPDAGAAPTPPPTPEPAAPNGDDLASLSERGKALLASAIKLQKELPADKKAKAVDLIMRIQTELQSPNRQRLDGLASELESLPK